MFGQIPITTICKLQSNSFVKYTPVEEDARHHCYCLQLSLCLVAHSMVQGKIQHIHHANILTDREAYIDC